MFVMLRIFIFALLLCWSVLSFGSPYYGARLCHKFPEEFDCYKVRRSDSWDSLFPGETEQDTVRRVNRMGINLQSGMVIAIPKDLQTVDVLALAPLPRQMNAPGEPIIVVSISQLAWAAYDAGGNLVRWGPVSSARGYCPDLHHGCHTPTGHYRIYSKGGPDCVSTKFPIGRGGAPMPYCMYFNGGFALHGSYEVPGYNASHGCIRMLVEDAQWLSQDFSDIGTRVIVEP